jgi:hypothetical protein
VSKRYDRPKAGEWVQPQRRGYKMACCDCCLVHTLDFRIVDGRVQFRVYRHNRATAAMRRANRIRVRTAP